MASGKPQKAVAVIVANCEAVKLNSTPNWPTILARMPNDSDVTKNDKQLAQRFRCLT